MFSTLGPLFKTVFRQTEPADTRHEIRREEKENSGKKKEEHERDDADDALWQDSTTVSLEALRTFLLEYLKTKDISAERQPLAETAHGLETTEQKPALTPTAARAVKAYTSQAPSSAFTPPVQQTPQPDSKTGPILIAPLRSEEVRSIHALIADIDDLDKKGIGSINIQMTGTFLESVADAVRLLKNNA